MWSSFGMSRLVRVAVLIALFTVSLPLWSAELVSLHNKDVLSRLESHLPAEAEVVQGGRVRLATLVDEIRGLYGAD